MEIFLKRDPKRGGEEVSKIKVTVSENFDIKVAAESLAYSFIVRGYDVRIVPYKDGF